MFCYQQSDGSLLKRTVFRTLDFIFGLLYYIWCSSKQHPFVTITANIYFMPVKFPEMR